MLDQITVTKEDTKPVVDFFKDNPFLIGTLVIVDILITGLYAIAKKEVSK